MDQLQERIELLYPGRQTEVYEKVLSLIEKWEGRIEAGYPFAGKEDVMLITYGDAIRNGKEHPLKALNEFLDEKVKGYISAVHLLPMFPYTSDDGFSVSDFRSIHPDMGDWEDVAGLKENYDLMFDAVVNHASKSSLYFREFLKGTEQYKNFFIKADSDQDYSMVTRPRALPLLTPFETASGTEYIWTTFSEDQIDFNYKDPEVLLEILDILLLYASKGARFIRFDAIGFAWKEDHTTCMHLPQTHELVKLVREVLETAAEGCTIITETNVPHKDNISYFGNGYDEAGLVYQFPLPPLTLHSFLSGNAEKLSAWAASLEPTTEATTYFNFLASHDGIGMRPVEDILTQEERGTMVEEVLKRGGQVGYRDMPDGVQVPYELNINYLDAIAGNETEQSAIIQKFMAAQCILLSVVGMPAIYYHSLLGSRNCYQDYEESGIKRRINREKLDLGMLRAELSDPSSLRSGVLEAFCRMLGIRKHEEAFSPKSPQRILNLDQRLFAALRGEEQQILAIINVSADEVILNTKFRGIELLSGMDINGGIQVPPYGCLWIKLDKKGE